MNEIRVCQVCNKDGDTERLKLFFSLYENISEMENRKIIYNREINKNIF